MCTALIAVIASVSGLNVAQGQLAADLGATQSQLLWVINGYTIALAALLLPVGAIGDRWGRKHILLGGLARVLRGQPARRAGGHPDAADRLPRAGRRRCGDDHAGHAVGDHVELPGRGPRSGGRRVGRRRRCRRDPRADLLGDPRRQLHLAVAVRRADRPRTDRRRDDRAVRAPLSRAPRRPVRRGRLGAVGGGRRGARARHPRGARARLDVDPRRRRRDRRAAGVVRLRLVGAAPGAAAARPARVRQPGAGRRVAVTAGHVRRDVRPVPGDDPVPPGGARLLGGARRRRHCCRWPQR